MIRTAHFEHIVLRWAYMSLNCWPRQLILWFQKIFYSFNFYESVGKNDLIMLYIKYEYIWQIDIWDMCMDKRQTHGQISATLTPHLNLWLRWAERQLRRLGTKSFNLLILKAILELSKWFSLYPKCQEICPSHFLFLIIWYKLEIVKFPDILENLHFSLT